MLFGSLLSLTQLYNTSHALVNEDVTPPKSLFQYHPSLINRISLLIDCDSVIYIALNNILIMQRIKC